MKIKRNKTFSGTPWETKFGYARAVQVGDVVHVSGTTGTDPSGKVLLPATCTRRPCRPFGILKAPCSGWDWGWSTCVRTRIYVTQIDRWEEVAKAHSEFFGQIHPATSLIGVARLIDPEMLVEIEADAVA